MRDTTQDTDRIDRIWRWIHNNIPGEPSRSREDVADCVIRLLEEGQEAKAAPGRGTQPQIADLNW